MNRRAIEAALASPDGEQLMNIAREEMALFHEVYFMHENGYKIPKVSSATLDVYVARMQQLEAQRDALISAHKPFGEKWEKCFAIN